MAASGSALLMSRRVFARQIQAHAPAATRKYHALQLKQNSSSVLFAAAASCRPGPAHTTPFNTRPQHHSRRGFSAVSALETTLTATQHVFTELHSLTGTPWYLTIPLIALSINLVTRFPMSIFSRRTAQRRAKLAPLLQAWEVRHAKDIAADPKTAAFSVKKRQAEVVKRVKRTSKRVYKIWGVQRFKDFAGFSVLPFWLVGIETLRRLCGGPRGLIGTLVFGPDEKAAVTSPGEAMAASSNPSDAVSVTDLASSSVLDNIPAGADPSLATGGCLWFPDLMVADPLHILPFALSAVLVLNILPRSQEGIRRLFGLDTNQIGVAQDNASVRLTRVFLIMAVAIGPATMDLPAAIHLYWLSSSALTLIQTDLLNKIMPIPKTKIKPCLRNATVYLRPARPQAPQL